MQILLQVQVVHADLLWYLWYIYMCVWPQLKGELHFQNENVIIYSPYVILDVHVFLSLVEK